MTYNFKFISPQMWWIVDVGFSHTIDRKHATEAQKMLYLDCQATNIFYQSMKDNKFGEIMYMKTAHDIWLYLNLIYGRGSNNDDDEAPKEEAHECIEHGHNLVIVKDWSTSWSSNDDDRSTVSSLDEIDGLSSSDANDDSTSSTLDGVDDDSCSDHDHDVTTSSPISLHCFMS